MIARTQRSRRYAKLAWIGLLAALVVPVPAHAEVVAPELGPALLAVAPDGSPRVAWFAGGDLVVARRTASGWKHASVGRVPGTRPVLAGLVVDGRGRPSVLLEGASGGWLALARPGAKLRVVARPRKGASFGAAGLTLDLSGRPAFAYTLRLSSTKTWLRLVTVDAHGRLDVHGITKGGFPSSSEAPGAAPVLVGRQLHVVQTYTSAAIDWHPKRGGGWEGQYLYASRIGTPAGHVGAVTDGTSLWSSWTQVSGEAISVLLNLSADTQATATVVEHGIFVSLFLADGRPEIGAYDWAQIGDSFFYTSVLADGDGVFSELDGRLLGYAAAPGGRRQLLLSTPSGLEWFEAPARPTVHVTVQADASGTVTGRITGATGGSAEIFRETLAGRSAVGRAELAADGSFVLQDTAPTSPTLYRAVWVNADDPIPYAALTRAPVG